jgi:hypothetical protein
MRFYISGPMTGYEQHNFPAFTEAARALRAVGHDVLPAHEITHEGDEQSAGTLEWSAYLRHDLIELCKQCDAIILLRGWSTSKGAQLELAVALGLGMRVYFWDPQCGLIDMNRTAV